MSGRVTIVGWKMDAIEVYIDFLHIILKSYGKECASYCTI